MMAVGAEGTRIPAIKLQRESYMFAIGAIIAHENMGKINIGICTGINGYQLNILELTDVDVDNRQIRTQHAASVEWKETNKLLTKSQHTCTPWNRQIVCT